MFRGRMTNEQYAVHVRKDKRAGRKSGVGSTGEALEVRGRVQSGLMVVDQSVS